MLLIAAAILATQAAPADGAMGLLVGIGHRAAAFYQGSPSYPASPQRLETCWIELAKGRSAEAFCQPGLVVPIGSRFVRYVMQRQTEKADSPPGRSWWRDALVPWPWSEPEPASRSWVPQQGGEEVPCGYSVQEVLFASPHVVSMRETGGASEVCESAGWSGVTRGWVRAFDSEEPLPMSSVAGRGAAKAYARAARAAHERWRKEMEVEFPGEEPPPCDCDPDADSRWIIVRDRTRWVAVVQQQTGRSYCHMAAAVDLELPSAVVGFREHPPSWADVVARHPGAASAHQAPDGSTLVVEMEDYVLVDRGSEQLHLPGGPIVMVQWATGKYVERWRDALHIDRGSRGAQQRDAADEP